MTNSKGNYIVCGTIWIDEIQRDDAYLMEIDSKGNQKWFKTYGGVGQQLCRSLIITHDGGYAFVGSTYVEEDPKRADAYVVRTDSLGNLLWKKMVGFIDSEEGEYNSDSSYGITQSLSGEELLLTGTTQYRTSKIDIFVAALNIEGEELWTRTYMTFLRDNFVKDIITTEDGNYLLAGSIEDKDVFQFNNKAWFLKIDQEGNEIWEQKVDMSWGLELIQEVIQLEDKGFVAFGTRRLGNKEESFDYSNPKGWLLRMDEWGDTLWTKTYTHPLTDIEADEDHYIWDGAVDQDGNFVLVGRTNMPETLQDAWVIKTRDIGHPPYDLQFEFCEPSPTVCLGNNLWLTSDVFGGSENYVEHSWIGENTELLSNTNTQSPFFTPTDTGTFTFQYIVTDSEGNTATESLQITVYESPTTEFFNSQITLEVGSGPLLLKSNTTGGLPPYTHQWIGTGANFLNATDQKFVSFEDAPMGNYELTYIVTDANGCIAFDVLPIVVEDSTIVGIEEVGAHSLQTSARLLKVYPNPVREVLFVEVLEGALVANERERNGENLLFYNALGQLVERVELKEKNLILNVSDWQRGVYFYRLENGLGSGKLVVE